MRKRSSKRLFLTLYRKIHTFEERAALGSRLYRIATNVALLKRRTRRPDREMSFESLLPTFLPDGHRAGDREFVRSDCSATPEAELRSHEAREVMRRALEMLPDQYRTV